jgi:hypothetical protein
MVVVAEEAEGPEDHRLGHQGEATTFLNQVWSFFISMAFSGKKNLFIWNCKKTLFF